MVIKAGILAIGDEVVQGQITNRNASWLASQLSQMNITTTHHIACLDQITDIHQSLDFLKAHCQIILISGGLGPTTDDCTRQSISQWLNKKLILNNEQWEIIENKLKQRQLTLREGHKNQAYIPEGSIVLENINGVAPGFFIQDGSFSLASMPGPPSELHSMFSNSLAPLIKEKLNPQQEQRLYTWICLGAPESEIAHIAESILSSSSNLSLAYRLHKPYVELKVWGPKSLNSHEEKLFSTLSEKLKPWYVSGSIDSIRKNFHQQLAQYESIYVIDHLTSGILLEKLKESYKSDHIRYQCFEHKAYRNFAKEEVQQIYQHLKGSDKQLFICLFPHSEKSALLFFNDQHYVIEVPRNISIKSTLGQLYAIEHMFLLGKTLLTS